jgi:hypothetical protein
MAELDVPTPLELSTFGRPARRAPAGLLFPSSNQGLLERIFAPQGEDCRRSSFRPGRARLMLLQDRKQKFYHFRTITAARQCVGAVWKSNQSIPRTCCATL